MKQAKLQLLVPMKQCYVWRRTNEGHVELILRTAFLTVVLETGSLRRRCQINIWGWRFCGRKKMLPLRKLSHGVPSLQWSQAKLRVHQGGYYSRLTRTLLKNVWWYLEKNNVAALKTFIGWRTLPWVGWDFWEKLPKASLVMYQTATSHSSKPMFC